MAKKAIRPVLRYHGGKFQMAPWIISHFPDHRIYTEVFGGGASVLLRKKRSYAEVYNDLDGEIVNIFRVLRDPAQSKELQRQLDLTPFSRDEFLAAYEPSDDPVEQARRTMLRSFAGRSPDSATGKSRTGFKGNGGLISSGTMTSHDWASFPSFIPLFHERFKGIVIENDNALEVLKRFDKDDALHYVDPPYVHETRGGGAYRHELTNEQHSELAAELHELKGMVVLSGYRSPLYDDLYADWQCITRDSHADGVLDRIECLWLNPAATRQQMRLEV